MPKDNFFVTERANKSLEELERKGMIPKKKVIVGTKISERVLKRTVRQKPLLVRIVKPKKKKMVRKKLTLRGFFNKKIRF